MNNSFRKILLAVGGCANILVSLLHIAMIFIGASAYQYFGAPASFVLHPDAFTTIVLMVLIIVCFLLAGLYGLSGAGLIRRIPFLNTALITIGVIYTLRGMVVLLMPFPNVVNKIVMSYSSTMGMDRSIVLHDWIFSFIWLFVGLCYLVGAKWASK